jgi:hypothetical protein
MSNLPMRCTCGAVTGEITAASPAETNRVVCYCDDCQTFARALGRPELMDAHGGSDIVQVHPVQLRITAGAEHIRLLRLSPKGLLRFHTVCCNTPIGNTLTNPKTPFLGISRHFFALDDAELNARIGPPRGGIQGRFAVGGAPAGVHPKVGPGLMLRTIWFAGSGWLRGRYAPSPVFNAATGAPVVEARVLSKEERASFKPGATA